MDVTKPSKPENSLQAITRSWKDRIICFSPQGEGYNAYLVDPQDGNIINYIHASCDELRHLSTNYNSLLTNIKEQYYGYLKEAVLNTVKYEATRRAFRKQHEWIQDSYKSSIEQKKLNAQQQEIEINKLRVILRDREQEINKIKSEYRGQLAASQVEALLEEKEAEIARKNARISQLDRQLQEYDREINTLKSELDNGLAELKQKYKWLITQFVGEYLARQQENSKNKSLQACQNIFKIAQRKIHSLQGENEFVRQEYQLKSQVKMLQIGSN